MTCATAIPSTARRECAKVISDLIGSAAEGCPEFSDQACLNSRLPVYGATRLDYLQPDSVIGI